MNEEWRGINKKNMAGVTGTTEMDDEETDATMTLHGAFLDGLRVDDEEEEEGESTPIANPNFAMNKKQG